MAILESSLTFGALSNDRPGSAKTVDGWRQQPFRAGRQHTYLKARTALTVFQAQKRQQAIRKKKGMLVDCARAETLAFRLTRLSRL